MTEGDSEQFANMQTPLYGHHVPNAGMRSKHITIEEEQAEWVEENYLNLSRFVQGQLQQLIEGDGELTN